MPRITARRRSRVVAGLLLSGLLMLSAACGGSEAEVSSELQSQKEDAFSVVEHDGADYAVGHGIALEMPEGWVEYDEEFEKTDGTTMEWAVGMPEDTKPFPAGLQLSAGIPGHGGQVRDGMATAAEKLAELSDGYELIDKGDADVEGADEAKYLHFKREIEYGGKTIPIEQMSLFIQTSSDTSTTIRFLAPEGEWESMMEPVFDSVRLTI